MRRTRLALWLWIGTLGTSVTAAAEPLWEAELRMGYGVTVGGGDGMTSQRASPLTIAATGAVAIREQPAVAAYGGLVVETLDRNSVGAIGGVRLTSGALRLSGGGAWIFAPRTLWGATVSGGACHRMSEALALCADLQLTAYFAGTDLADGRTATQLQGVVGMVVDGF
ncbi:MAG: hypothetical protein ACTHU0_18010 [Kofleriaceae bacterium]